MCTGKKKLEVPILTASAAISFHRYPWLAPPDRFSLSRVRDNGGTSGIFFPWSSGAEDQIQPTNLCLEACRDPRGSRNLGVE